MRKLSLLLTFIVFLALTFNFVWNRSLGELKREAVSVKSTRVAFNLTAQTFEGEKRDWLVEGSKAEFFKKGFVLVKGFVAEKDNANLKVIAESARINLKKGLIHLRGGVVLEISKGKDRYKILTESAQVDLKRGVIFGNNPCRVLSNRGTLKGKGFYYDYRNGILSVEGGVTTVIGR